MHQDANVPLTYLRHKGHSSTCKFNDMKYRIFSLFYIAIVFVTQMAAEDGSHLWLRLPANAHAEISAPRQSPTLNIAVEELQQAWKGAPVRLVIQKDKQLQPEGFRIRHEDNKITLTSPTETGLLYAAYHLLRMQETGQNVVEAQTTENPAYNLRILNHWDNMDRTVERGYAGQSLWNWEELPNTLSDRYKEYARANASIGINGTVLNNVNASPKILSAEYLQKVKALADIFRPYGLRVYLSVNFASPMALDSLSTADPLDKEVIRWWKNKVKEIYRIIPDFGGFLVKANSEGQPGPCDFGRTHAEGANMLADALKPYKGIVMWRAFVYSPSDADRAKQAYLEFEPLDGQFRNNVIVQVKNDRLPAPRTVQSIVRCDAAYTANGRVPSDTGIPGTLQPSCLSGTDVERVLRIRSARFLKGGSRCSQHRYRCQLVRTHLCTSQLVCFRPPGMATLFIFRKHCR